MENKETTKEKLSNRELMIVYALQKIKHPYRNLTVNDVSKDLGIGINSAYDLFKREDFPSIEIGKQKTITLLAYLLWKMEKHK